MGNRYKYRFRTKEEFIKEFGKDWTRNVRFTWNSYYMDCFLGKDLSDYVSYEDIISYEKIGDVRFTYGNDGFRAGTDMIVKEYLTPSYKPKKIIRSI
jgi:hypothetical protein